MKLWYVPPVTILLCVVASFAQQQEVDTDHSLIEIGGGYSYDGFHNWSGPSLRSNFVPRDSDLSLNVQVARVEEFGDMGTAFKGGLTYDMSENWYTTLQMSSSSGGFFLPRVSTRISIGRGWLPGQRLDTTVGMGYVRWKDATTEYDCPVGVSYEFAPSWSAQAEVNFEVTSPSSVFSHTQFVSVSQGKEERHLVTLGGEFGTEAFQIIGPNTTLSNFHSSEITLKWRQWAHRGWGWSVGGLYYLNREYQRKSVELGIFKEF
jgi:YaiO family outer membrane protein